MKTKTSELTGRALEIAVDLAHGYTFRRGVPDNEVALDPACRQGLWRLNPSGDHWACMTCMRSIDEPTDFEELVAREGIGGMPPEIPLTQTWRAYIGSRNAFGATPREAAFRCFVASKLGDEVDVPEELCT
jgi:hypothetical protein